MTNPAAYTTNIMHDHDRKSRDNGFLYKDHATAPLVIQSMFNQADTSRAVMQRA